MSQRRVLGIGLAALMGAATLLGGCDDMHDQPSFKPQEAPRILPAEGSVSQRGVERLGWETVLENPIAKDQDSRQRGERLYRINCVFCHGFDEQPGQVGKKLQPPPPDLHQSRIQALSDGDLFKRISLGFGRMPPFQKRLTSGERWHLVNYLQASAPE